MSVTLDSYDVGGEMPWSSMAAAVNEFFCVP
jgi:hypothetical protein